MIGFRSGDPDSPTAWYDTAAKASSRFLLIAAAVVVLAISLIALRVIVLPLTFAVVVGAVLTPPARSLRKRGLPPGLASFAIVLALIALVVFVVVLAIRSIVAQSGQLVALVSSGLDVVEAEVQNHLGADADLTADTRAAITSGLGSLTRFAVGGLFSILPATLELLSAALLTVIILYFLLKDGERIWGWTTGQFPRQRDLLERVGRAVWEVLRRFMAGTTLIAAIDAVGIGLGMWLIGVPYAGAIGVLTFLLAYIPMVGATISGTFGVLLALGDGDLSQGVAALIVVLVVQQIEGNLLQPFIMGSAVRLHPLAVALGLVVGATFAGIVGMFLAVPLVASAAAVVAELRASGVLGPAGLAGSP